MVANFFKDSSVSAYITNEFGGILHLNLYLANLDGTDVFIKVPLTREDAITEGNLLSFFNSLNVSQAVLGLYEDPSGRIGIVSKFIPGRDLDMHSSYLPEYFEISDSTFQRLEFIQAQLEKGECHRECGSVTTSHYTGGQSLSGRSRIDPI